MSKNDPVLDPERRLGKLTEAAESTWMVTWETLEAVNQECLSSGLTPSAAADRALAAYKAKAAKPHSDAGVLETEATIRSKYPAWHRMLDEILNSGVQVCVDGMIAKLEAYSTTAEAMKDPAHSVDRRRVGRRRSDRPQKRSNINFSISQRFVPAGLMPPQIQQLKFSRIWNVTGREDRLYG